MFSKAIYVTACLLCLSLISRAQSPAVYFIPTIHSLHKTNNNYSYDSLKLVVARLKPDIIAVEIRPEDVDQDSSYVSKHYPYEMRMMKFWFPNTHITGFDWLGEDIEGKPIPANYWKEISAIKKYERELDADTSFSKQLSACDTFANQRLKLLQHLSLRDLLKSNDSILTKAFYNCLERVLAGTLHERLLRFYGDRNDKMLLNITNIIQANKGKRIVILTGDDHYVYLKGKFQSNEMY